jgi:superoxide reductase
MVKINRYVEIDEAMREAKKDFIDRHSPFVTINGTPKKGEKVAITVKVGNEYTHPDDFDHYISNISLYNGNTLLARADFVAGTLGNEKSQVEVTFNIIPTTKKLNLVAHSYCTKHGVWESEVVTSEVAE